MVKIENKRGEGNERNMGTSLMVQFLRLHAAKTGGLGLIPGQGTRSHVQPLRVLMPQPKTPLTATKKSCVPQLRPGAAK